MDDYSEADALAQQAPEQAKEAGDVASYASQLQRQRSVRLAQQQPVGATPPAQPAPAQPSQLPQQAQQANADNSTINGGIAYLKQLPGSIAAANGGMKGMLNADNRSDLNAAMQSAYSSLSAPEGSAAEQLSPFHWGSVANQQFGGAFGTGGMDAMRAAMARKTQPQ